ncbi:hypothetical protein ABZ934_22195, partial [Streptomyces sp. NPDC046557]
STKVSGEILFRHWVLPFEALSVLLLAALIGASPRRFTASRALRSCAGVRRRTTHDGGCRTPGGPAPAGNVSAGPGPGGTRTSWWG